MTLTRMTRFGRDEVSCRDKVLAPSPQQQVALASGT